MNIDEVQSPFIKEALNNSNLRAVETPIIENIEDGYLVHFIYYGDNKTTSVHILGSFPGWELENGKMSRIEGSQIWVKSFKTNIPLASTYYFSINDDYEDDWGKRFEHLITDPLNPKKMVFSESPDEIKKQNTEVSYISVNEPLQSMDISNKNSNIQKKDFPSTRLNNHRNLWVYDPIETGEAPKNLLIIFDGFQYTEAIPVASMLDNLYEDGKIDPTVMIGVDSPDRFKELNGNDQFSDFITSELLPWIKRKFNVSHNPKDIALCGASLGGLAAFNIAIKHSQFFGNVISQSGSFNRKKSEFDQDMYWSVNYLESHPCYPVRVFMNAGILEMEELKRANLLTYQTLKQKGYDVEYAQFNGGHDLLWWRETFINGLIYLFGKE